MLTHGMIAGIYTHTLVYVYYHIYNVFFFGGSPVETHTYFSDDLNGSHLHTVEHLGH